MDYVEMIVLGIFPAADLSHGWDLFGHGFLLFGWIYLGGAAGDPAVAGFFPQA